MAPEARSVVPEKVTAGRDVGGPPSQPPYSPVEDPEAQAGNLSY